MELRLTRGLGFRTRLCSLSPYQHLRPDCYTGRALSQYAVIDNRPVTGAGGREGVAGRSQGDLPAAAGAAVLRRRQPGGGAAPAGGIGAAGARSILGVSGLRVLGLAQP